MLGLAKGRYVAREAGGPGDIARAQALRHWAFHGKPGLDADAYDDRCRHVLIEDRSTERLVACFRLLPLETGRDIAASYSAQYYDLAALAAYEGRMVELGRFCIDPEVRDPDILRVAWGALTAFVDAERVQLLFGCSSFHGTDADQYLDAFTVLSQRHTAPRRWWPRVKAPQVFRFGRLRARVADAKLAQLRMPPLLKTYLLMGGWVSDHAVVDRQMNTLHVFTGLEIAAIPETRKRLLRAVAG